MVEIAQAISELFHAEQVDKGGMPYFSTHIVQVWQLLSNESEEIQAVALLHDVIEDTSCTMADLCTFPEIPFIVLEAIDAITHYECESLSEYYARVRANPIALKVKLADIESNCDPARRALLSPDVDARLTKKYEKARKALLNHETL